jgi:2-haloacid dehalogenase
VKAGVCRHGVIALDVYGTLVDTAGITVALGKSFWERAPAAAQLWREKQLEYTFRRALMERYVDFDTVTRQALRYVTNRLGVDLSAEAENALLTAYLELPAFPDVMSGLEVLKRTGMKLVALSNGTGHSVRGLLERAGIAGYFTSILSVERVRTFKPAPSVYALLSELTDEYPQRAWLVSGNPFDVIGAKAQGLKAAWLKRDASSVFDPWEYAPDIIASTLPELGGELERLS